MERYFNWYLTQFFALKYIYFKSFRQLELENGCDLFVLLSLSLQQLKKVNVTLKQYRQP